MYYKNIILLQTVAPTITTSTTTPGTVTTAPTTTSAPTATTVQTAQTSTPVYFISIKLNPVQIKFEVRNIFHIKLNSTE